MLKYMKGGKEGKKRRSGVPGATPLDQFVDNTARTNNIRIAAGKSPLPLKPAENHQQALKSARIDWSHNTVKCPNKKCGHINDIWFSGPMRCWSCGRKFNALRS